MHKLQCYTCIKFMYVCKSVICIKKFSNHILSFSFLKVSIQNLLSWYIIIFNISTYFQFHPLHTYVNLYYKYKQENLYVNIQICKYYVQINVLT